MRLLSALSFRLYLHDKELGHLPEILLASILRIATINPPKAQMSHHYCLAASIDCLDYRP